jgi:hypothetical protein
MESTIVNIITKHSESNYFEFHFTQGKNIKLDNDITQISTSFSKQSFYDLLQKTSTSDYKFSQKQYKEAIVGNIVYQNNKNEDITIFNIDTKDVCILDDNNVVCFAHNKNKLTILSLPSTNSIHYEHYVKRLTLRLSNRIFINFEHSLDSNDKVYRVYLNYNHDNNVDIPSVAKSINQIIKELTAK